MDPDDEIFTKCEQIVKQKSFESPKIFFLNIFFPYLK